MRKSLPDSVIGPALIDDVAAVLPYVRAAPDRLYLRQAHTGRSLFHLAALSPKPTLLRELMDLFVTDRQPYSINEVDYDGCHAAHLCAREGHLEHLDLLVRFNTDTSGQPKFPNPLVDNRGRSVASYAKVPVEWHSYGKAMAEVLTRPHPALHPSNFIVDDIISVLTLKKPFAGTPLPWLTLPDEADFSLSRSSSPRSPGSQMLNSPLLLQIGRPKSPFRKQRAKDAVQQHADQKDDTDQDAEGMSLTVPSAGSVATARLSLSLLSQQTPVIINSGYGALILSKHPVYVAEMIFIQDEIQFDCQIFYHDTDISGPLTLRGVALHVDYYRPSTDPDVVMAAWYVVANPDARLFLCRRVPKPQVADSTTKKGNKLRKVLNALDASLELYARVGKSGPRAGGASPLAPSKPGVTGSAEFSSPVAASAKSSAVFTATESGEAGAAGADGEDVLSDNDAIEFTVAEASDIILQTLRQRLWGMLRQSVSVAIRKIYVVKRFVRKVLDLRSRCVNLFFAKLLPVLDAVRHTLDTRKRIVVRQEMAADTHYLSLNIPSSAVHAVCRRCVRRKDHRWHVSAHDVFTRMAPLIVGPPDLQATLIRLLADEWLLPTAERIRLAAADSPSPKSPRGPSPKASRPRVPSKEIVRCSAHSPIAYLVGTGFELRAMLLPRETGGGTLKHLPPHPPPSVPS